MGDITERHEVRVGSGDHVFVFIADSSDGRLVIREETASPRGAKDVCSLTLANPDELRDFFEGLRRVLVTTGHAPAVAVPSAAAPAARLDAPPRVAPGRPPGRPAPEEREAVIDQARQRNPNAFQPWSSEEEREVKERFQRGESVEAIARAKRRSPRAIEMRLQKMGVLPASEQ
ncbi:MAG TPA: hypothetical protein VGQ78_10675 [Vicinamibacteria bacterium]|jgi:hypothetical protein|nr:hypothetical protein [Vicinamibacteria bacterium]